MTWVDGPGWHADRARRLSELLVEGYPTDAAMRTLVQQVGLPLTIMPPDAWLGVRWFALVQSLHAAGRLRRAAELLTGQSPVLADRVHRLLEDDAPDPGNPEDPYEVQLLPGRRPLIDRGDLRETLRQFLTRQRPAFVVRGDPRTGKSYSFELLLHVTEGRDDLDLIRADFSEPAEGNDAPALMAKLRSRLGLPRLPPQLDPSTRVRSAGGLVDDLVGDYRQLSPVRRIIVIDGLNRADLNGDVHQLAAGLIKEVIQRGLPRTQIVITGYTGDVDPALAELVMDEHVLSLTEIQIRLFYESLRLDRELTTEEIDRLVADAAVGQGDIADLALRVQESIRRLLQPVAGGAR